LRELLLADLTETLLDAIKECNKIYNELSKPDGIKEHLEYKRGAEIKLNILSKDRTQYDFVHYAGHAYFDEKNICERR